ncbi:MAG: ABC transporter substrate-binding protein [Tissierellia bacterium]|nr:ABC transporter substrate-binding protein [Tissierellia bacterium]
MKKKMLALILGLALILSACGSKNTNDNAKNNESQEQKNVSEIKEPIKIGIIQLADHIALDRSREGFLQELEDADVKIEVDYVNAAGELAQIPAIVNKFKDDEVDLIYAIATPAAQGAKNIITDIPIVFSAVTNPVDSELVASNEEPGGNITGVSDYYSSQAQLESFLEFFPQVKKLGVLYSTNEANSVYQIEELKEIAENLDLELNIKAVNSVNDVSTAMSSLASDMDAFIGINDNLVSSSSQVIANRLKEAKIPSFAYEAGPVENGLLMSDGVNFEDLGKEAGKIAIKIFEGEDPATIPVFYSQKTEITVNETTAKALELDKMHSIFNDANIVY